MVGRAICQIFMVTMMTITMSSLQGCKQADEEVGRVEVDASALEIYKFGAEWCGPCQEMKRDFWNSNEVKAIKGDFKDFHDIDGDSPGGRVLVARYNIKGYPTVILVHNGKEVARKVGYSRAMYSEYLSWLKKYRKG